MNDIESDEIMAQIREARKAGHEERPLVVMAFGELPGKFAIVNGNHRALLAEWEKRPMEAIVIETEQDFTIAEEEEATRWGESSADENGRSQKSRYERVRSEVLQAALALSNRV